jgi:hypothetical protein
MVGKEIGALVYEKYYAADNVTPSTVPAAGFDFNSEMRVIRQTVDVYLARGEIDEAEKYMADRQQYLASKGYTIRKLNQAYFAFYGTYADSPTSIDPIGADLKLLRAQSPSLKDFLSRVASMTSRQDITNSLNSAKVAKAHPG